MLIETHSVNGCSAKILLDEDPQSPRDWDNLSRFLCFHRRYTLGDKHAYRSGDFASWNDFRKALLREDPGALLVPLFMYDHSGLTIATKPFSCPWDSGQIGFAVVSSARIRKEYQAKRITSKLRERVRQAVDGEVAVYDAFLRGEVYGYVIERNGQQEDSCWGFFGLEDARAQLIDAMVAA